MKVKTYMNIAKIVAQESKCVSLKVGSVIVNPAGKIISTGYNGTVSGDVNCNSQFSGRCEEHHEWSLKREIHSEINAIANADTPVRGCSLYCTHCPCYNCLKHLAAFGILTVVFDEYYHRHTDKDLEAIYEYASNVGLELLKRE